MKKARARAIDKLQADDRQSETQMRELALDVRKARPTKRNRTMAHVNKRKADIQAFHEFVEKEEKCVNDECPGGRCVIDTERSTVICTLCGASNRIISKEAYCPFNIVRKKSRSAVYTRRSYLNELLRQWLMIEPPLYHIPSRKLLVAYWKWTMRTGEVRQLDKSDIKDVIDIAELSRKRFLEKWRSIRVLVQGGEFPFPPRPDNDTVAAIESAFLEVNRVWNGNAELRARAGRKSIISTYYIIRRLLMMMSGDVFRMWGDEFPIPDTERDSKRLFTIWTDICICLAWPVRVVTRVVETAHDARKDRLHRAEQ